MPILHTLPAFQWSSDELHRGKPSVVRRQHDLFRFCAEHVLGTRLEILIHSDSQALARMAADAAHGDITRLDPVLNDPLGDSELTRLQRSGSASVSDDLFSVL